MPRKSPISNKFRGKMLDRKGRKENIAKEAKKSHYTASESYHSASAWCATEIAIDPSPTAVRVRARR
jgi:hypothetical protein